jgi:hypothetical protein
MANEQVELWALLYLHNWDESGKVWPEIHQVYPNFAAAEDARKAMSDPSLYWVRRTRMAEKM